MSNLSSKIEKGIFIKTVEFICLILNWIKLLIFRNTYRHDTKCMSTLDVSVGIDLTFVKGKNGNNTLNLRRDVSIERSLDRRHILVTTRTPGVFVSTSDRTEGGGRRLEKPKE